MRTEAIDRLWQQIEWAHRVDEINECERDLRDWHAGHSYYATEPTLRGRKLVVA